MLHGAQWTRGVPLLFTCSPPKPITKSARERAAAGEDTAPGSNHRHDRRRKRSLLSSVVRASGLRSSSLEHLQSNHGRATTAALFPFSVLPSAAAAVLLHRRRCVCRGTFFFLFFRLCIFIVPLGSEEPLNRLNVFFYLVFLFSAAGEVGPAPRPLADVKVERRSEKRSDARGAGLWLLRTPRTIARRRGGPLSNPHTLPAHVRNATPLAAQKRQVSGKFSSSRSLMSLSSAARSTGVVVTRGAHWLFPRPLRSRGAVGEGELRPRVSRHRSNLHRSAVTTPFVVARLPTEKPARRRDDYVALPCR